MGYKRTVATQGLTVAITGPTGDLGIAVVAALERSRAVKRVVGMARRPFDPAERGWKKTEYREGDVQDERSVRELVKGADAVVHLAFAILSAGDATRELNVEGSRRVFEEAAKAGAQRILYASSVAAYGFHDDNPDWLTEEIPARGTPEHFYSAAEGGGRGSARPDPAAPSRDRRLRVPAVHRGRPQRPDAGRRASLRAALGLDAGRGSVAAVLDARAQAGHPRPGNAVPARARGRRGVGVLGRRQRQGRTRSLQPRGQGNAQDERLGRRAGLVLGARPRSGARRRRRGSGAAAAARRRVLDPHLPQAGTDEDRAARNSNSGGAPSTPRRPR